MKFEWSLGVLKLGEAGERFLDFREGVWVAAAAPACLASLEPKDPGWGGGFGPDVHALLFCLMQMPFS